MLLRIRKDPFDKASLDTLTAGTTYEALMLTAAQSSALRRRSSFGRTAGWLDFDRCWKGRRRLHPQQRRPAGSLGRCQCALAAVRVDNAQGSLDPDLEWTYKTAAMAVKGLKLPVNYTAAVNALASLPATPTSCASIYSGTPDAELAYTSDTVATICAEPASSYSLPSQAQMFRHCIEQFKLSQFVRTTTTVELERNGARGTFGLPVYGQKLDPILPLATSAGLGNSSMTTEQRRRTNTATATD